MKVEAPQHYHAASIRAGQPRANRPADAVGVCISNSNHAAATDTGSEPQVAVFTMELKCVCWCDAIGNVVGTEDTWLMLSH